MAVRLRIAGGRLALLALLLAALAAHVYPASAETWFEYMGIEPPFNPEGNVLKPLTAGYIRTSSDDYFKYWIINQGVEYVTRPVNGKMATVFTIPPNGSLTLTIALNNVRLNATTRVHVEVCFLTPSPPLSLCFGALRPHYDRSSPEKYSLGGGYYIGPGFILYFAQENVSFRIDGLVIPNCLVGEWYAADLSTSMVPFTTAGIDYWNFTGLYFACPAYADVSIFCSSYNETVEVAITNFAIWDDKPSLADIVETGFSNVREMLGGLSDRLKDLKITVTRVEGGVALIQTGLGEVSADVRELRELLESALIRIENGIAEARTSIGLIQVELNALKDLLRGVNATITELIVDAEGRVTAVIEAGGAKIAAGLDALNAAVTAVHGGIARLETAVGELSVELDELKELLRDANAAITGIIVDSEGRITAKIDAGSAEIAARLDALNASIASVHGGVAAVGTALGELKASLAVLGASAAKLIIESENRTIVQMQTLLGPVNAALEELGGKVAAVHGNVASVLIPGLGEVKAAVAEDAGKAAKIEWIAAAAAALSLIAAASSILGLLKTLRREPAEEKPRRPPDGGAEGRGP